MDDPAKAAQRTRRKATLSLLLVCLFWGATFLWMEQGTDALAEIHGSDNSAVIGAAYMKGPPEGGLSIGAWATIGCAVVFGAHILLTDYVTKRADPMAITLTMLLWSVVWTGLALVM